ncbi:helix-turn-helix transcriptional regulator [Vibrio owensii]|uniref:helix-turn-helix transcriptional regulator n=1 Tax=Vibrio owensii TaxID=696485 RepID=UPI003390A907
MNRATELSQPERVRFVRFISRLEQSMLELGKQIRHAREYRGFTQAKMAEELGIARQTYVDIEKGKSRPHIDTIYKIAFLTNRSIEWLMTFEKKECGTLCGLREIRIDLVTGEIEKI